ncbi:major facilitator superfamily domain-containing protein [Echria macrotheca]|uniref:Major facilitator superfamily domain-containing protein n=1 Tax=Echria macrotheca TaxID=438768 RepID=A0AAJ0B5E4_9PEZI|nr:major facilitator superfamily domain-containing protein [Echria macrotheca]
MGSESTNEAVNATKTEPVDVEDEYADAERNYKPKTFRFWAILLGIYLALFLVALDRTIIAIPLAAITNEFSSIQDIGWYGGAYMLTNACFTPFFGRVYKIYSTRWVFLSSIVVFEAGSALCGAAPTSAAFIVGRAIAGAGAAGIFSGGTMLMMPIIPVRKRPIYISLSGMTFALSSVLGPLIGGTLTENVTWRWCFYINLPIGSFTFLAILFLFRFDPPKHEKLGALAQFKHLDPIGFFFLAPSMISLLLALQWGGSVEFPWSAPRIIGLFVTFAVLFVVFVVVQVMIPDTAMAPPRVVLNRSIAGSMFFMFLLSGGMMCIAYYLSVWFQAAQGQSAVQAGIRSLPLVLGLTVMGLINAVFTQKVGYYLPSLFVAPVLSAVGAGLLSTLQPDSGKGAWIGYQALYGLGLGCGFQSSMLPSQTVLRRADVPLGISLQFFMQQLGGAVFLAVGQNIFQNNLVDRLSGVAGLDPQIIVNTGSTDLRKIVPPNEVGAVLDAFNYSLTRVFLLAAGLSAAMILGALVIEPKNIKKTRGAGNGGKGDEAKAEEGKSSEEISKRGPGEENDEKKN